MTVTIGIAAYNEEDSIDILLDALLKQQVDSNIIIEKIIVISDGSTDATVAKVKEFTDQRIQIIESNERKGKSERVNEICSLAESDILILLDADIKITAALIQNMVDPFLSDDSLSLLSGTIVPLPPHNFTQKVLFAGIELWNRTREMVQHADVYYCTGAIRAFRKKLYKQIHFPMVTAEDVYPYLYCVSNGFKFRYIKSAKVYYNLPTTYTEYVKQMNRYLGSANEHERLFGKELIQREYTITTGVKVRALVKSMFFSPFWTGMYVLYLLMPKLSSLVKQKEHQATWERS